MAKNNMTREERESIIKMARAGMKDAVIAKAVGRSVDGVKSARIRAGVYIGTRRDALQPTPEQIEELRHVSDRAMARKYGLCQKSWALVRVRNGIARFRAPTTGKNAPVRAAKEKAQPYKEPGRAYHSTFAQKPAREYSPATEAQRYLQSQGWMVVNRAKVYGGDGWNVGRMVLSEEAMLEMASKKGFQFAGYL